MIKKLLSSKYSFYLLLVLAFVVRLYGINNPLADWHSWRQVDTASVSRNFLDNNFDILHPTYHDLSNVPSDIDNPQGYRFVEFPLYNVLHASLFSLIGIFTFEAWGRLITILSSLITIVFIYLLMKKYADSVSAFFAAFFFSFLPFSIYYSRTILPDPHMVMAIMGGIYFFDKYLRSDSSKKNENFNYILAIIFTAIAILVKPYALIFALPMLVLSYQKYGRNFITNKKMYIFLLVTITPFILWRMWMSQYPEGIPQSDWLFNDDGIRFKGAFFYWLFAERLGRLILGYWGLILMGFGLLAASKPSFLKKEGIFFYSFLISSLLYLTIIAKGNVQHDYYQILIIPTVVIFLGLGSNFLLNPPREHFNKILCSLLLALCIAFTLMFGWYHIRDYYNINNRKILEAGSVVDRLTPKDAKIVALYDGDTTLLYQTKRSGWASYQDSLPVLIKKGANYLLQLDPTEKDVQSLGEQYEVIYNTQGILLVKLK